MSAVVIDAFDFARLHEHREGKIAVADLPRLAKECVDASGTLHWSLDGGYEKYGRPDLTLTVSTTVQLQCQRCMAPLPLEIASKSVLVLAKNEAAADELDELLDDEALEVIVGSKEFNVLELIEDEVLLALPLSPRHDVCPDASALDAVTDSKPSPFAILKGIK